MSMTETEAIDYTQVLLELVSGLVLELAAQGVVDLERLRRLVLIQQERVGLARWQEWASSATPQLCGQLSLPFGTVTGDSWVGGVSSQVEPSRPGGRGCGEVWDG